MPAQRNSIKCGSIRSSTKPQVRLPLLAFPISVAVILAFTGTVTSDASGATAPSSPARVAQSYIAAIGPANAELTKVEAELKALSITASSTQVSAIVKPLGQALKPLEALIAGAPSAPPPSVGPSIALPNLGPPTIVYVNAVFGGCGGFQTPPTAKIREAHERKGQPGTRPFENERQTLRTIEQTAHQTGADGSGSWRAAVRRREASIHLS
jgi:hypothetical protein